MPGEQRSAQVARDYAPDPEPELRDEGLVEAQLFPDTRDLFYGRLFPGDNKRGVSRGNEHDGEREDSDEHDNGHAHQDSPGDVTLQG